MNQPTLILICGLPGAGKTTLAKKLAIARQALNVCPDLAIRKIIADPTNQVELSRLRDPVEQLIWDVGKKVLALGQNVILENGFWSETERNGYRDYARAHGYRVELHFLEVSKEELWRRIELRNQNLSEGDFVLTEAELDKDWALFEAPTAEELASYDFYSELMVKVIDFVNQAYPVQQTHFERTLYWLLQLDPEADEALQIAAYSHDIERGKRLSTAVNAVSNSDNGFKDQEYLQHHQEGGAKIMHDFLLSQNASADLGIKVSNLIAKHEVGGNPEQNILKDADSVSFFETTAENFINKYYKEIGKEKVRQKLDWMWERISSDQAKRIAEPMYQRSLKILAELVI